MPAANPLTQTQKYHLAGPVPASIHLYSTSPFCHKIPFNAEQ